MKTRIEGAYTFIICLLGLLAAHPAVGKAFAGAAYALKLEGADALAFGAAGVFWSTVAGIANPIAGLIVGL